MIPTTAVIRTGACQFHLHGCDRKTMCAQKLLRNLNRKIKEAFKEGGINDIAHITLKPLSTKTF